MTLGRADWPAYSIWLIYVVSTIGYTSVFNAGGGSSWDSSSFDSSGGLDNVLEYDQEKQEWNPIGSMSVKRSEHAISVINYNSIKDYCN